MTYSNFVFGEKISINDLQQEMDSKAKDFVKNIDKKSFDKISKKIGKIDFQEKNLLTLSSIKCIVDNWDDEKSVHKVKKLLLQKFYSLNETEDNHESSLDKIEDPREKILFISYFTETEDPKKIKELINKLDSKLVSQIPLSDKIALISKISAVEDTEGSLVQKLASFCLAEDIKRLSDDKQRIQVLRQIAQLGEDIYDALTTAISEAPEDWGLGHYDFEGDPGLKEISFLIQVSDYAIKGIFNEEFNKDDWGLTEEDYQQLASLLLQRGRVGAKALLEHIDIKSFSLRQLQDVVKGLKTYGFEYAKKFAILDKFPIEKLSHDEKLQLFLGLIDQEVQSQIFEKNLIQEMPKPSRLALARRILSKGIAATIGFSSELEQFKIHEFSPDESFEIAKKIILSSENSTKCVLEKIQHFGLENMKPSQRFELANLISNQGRDSLDLLRSELDAFKLDSEMRTILEQKINPENFEKFFNALKNDKRVLDMVEKRKGLGGCKEIKPTYRLKLPDKVKNGSIMANEEDKKYLETCVSSFFTKNVKTKADVAEALFDEVKKKQLRIKKDSELKLVFSSSVQPDGSGDYFSELELVKGVREVYPNSNIRVFYKHFRKLPTVDYGNYNLKDEEVMGFRDRDSPITSRRDFGTMECISGVVWQKDLPENILESYRGNPANTTHLDKAVNLAKFITEADIFFDVSASLNFYSLIRNNTPCFKYFEYKVAMGTGPTMAGIHRVKTDTSGAFKRKNVAKIFEQCGENKPYFCYMRTPHKFIEYVITQDYWKGKREINILALAAIGDTTLLAEDLKKKKLPISKITLIDGELNESVTVNNPDQAEAMIVRIYQGARMQHSDFMKAMDRSNTIVGCTGDISFAEVVGLEKMPFYENIGYKSNVLRGMISIAKHFKFDDLVRFFQSVPKGGDLRGSYNEGIRNKRLPEFLNEYKIEKADFDLAKAEEQMKELAEFYHKYHSVNDVIIRDINQNYLMKKHGKELKKIESDFVKRFNEGNISAEELQNNYLKELEKFEDLEITRKIRIPR